MTFASTGVGSPPHLTLELLQSAAGVKFVHVPYRGAAPALTDLLGGQVQVFAADAPVLMSNIKGGKIRALGAASGQRNPMLPDVPTLAEQGYPNTVVDNWYGLLAPAKTPPAIIAKINDAFVKAINDPVVKKKLIDSGAIPVADTPARVRQVLQEWNTTAGARWSRERSGIKDGRRADGSASRSGRYSPVAGSRPQRRHAGALGIAHPHRMGAVELVVDALPFPVEQLDQDDGADRAESPERQRQASPISYSP